MSFRDFLVESSSREQTASNTYKKKAVDGLDKAEGNDREYRLGRSILKDINDKYGQHSTDARDSLSSVVINEFTKANSVKALEGAKDFSEEVKNDHLVTEINVAIKKLDTSKGTSTGSGDMIKKLISSIRPDGKFGDFAEYKTELRFPDKKDRVTKVSESVKVAAANLYYQHKTKYFKKIDTVSSKASIIIATTGSKVGEIQHIIYDDNGTTVIRSFGALNLLDDALSGDFNDRTVTEI